MATFLCHTDGQIKPGFVSLPLMFDGRVESSLQQELKDTFGVPWKDQNQQRADPLTILSECHDASWYMVFFCNTELLLLSKN